MEKQKKEPRFKWLTDLIIYTVIIFLCLLCILPFIHVFAKSISDEAYVIANKVFLLPKGVTLSAYKSVFEDASIIRSFYVAVILTISCTMLGMLVTLFAAYPLSRRTLKGRSFLTLLFMITMYFTGGIIPDYLLMNNLNLLDTIWCMILPMAFSPYNLLIMKTSLQAGIPDSLIESAHIEGASEFTILTKIVMPLSKPIIATLTLFYAVKRWNHYQDALFYVKQKVSLQPLQLKLYNLVVAASEAISDVSDNAAAAINPEVIKAACIMFATIPIICIYPFIQKYFVQGTMIGSVKE